MIYVAHVLTLFLGPILMIGIINRVKARWAGRQGFPLFQLLFDLLRLLRKGSVYSTSSSWVSQLLGVVLFSTAVVASLFTPIFPGVTLLSFEYDFVFLVYLLGLGRIFLMLGALDAGSSFEGMGASREASYSVMIEPAWFLALGALAFGSGLTSMDALFKVDPQVGVNVPVVGLVVLTLFILIQVESCRVPVDDPNTHLELTMIHEVMVLDQCGVDFALVQYSSALKMTLFAGLIASLTNPFSVATETLSAVGFSWAALVAVAILIGLVESVMPRVRLQTIPRYIFIAVLVSGLALVLSLTQIEGLP